MKRFLKFCWFGVNTALFAAFCAIYLRFTYPLFSPPYQSYNVIFIFLFLIFLEGFVESFIFCFVADENSWQCWASQALLTGAIVALYLSSYLLYTDIKQIFDAGNAVAVAIGLILVLGEVIVSPMIISKFSSWFLLGINLFGGENSKKELIFPGVLLAANTAAAIISSQVDMTRDWLIAYICVFGALSIASLALTIHKNF